MDEVTTTNENKNVVEQSLQSEEEQGSLDGSVVSPYFEDKEKVVIVNGLYVVYNTGKLNEAIALDGVNFDIRAEEYITIFGPSGCGKSTVLNVIAGLEIPSSGNVTIIDQDLASLSSDELAYFHRNRVGMIFQQYNLIPTLSVLDNVILPLVFEKRSVRERKKLGKEMLRRLGLGDFEKRFPQELSGGQQQRVGIARALITDPPIILADEAVGNLDSQSAKNVLEILDDLNLKSKKTIISVTHNPEHLFYADRVFYMRDGKLVKVEINKEKERNDAPQITKERTEFDILLQSFPDLSPMHLHIMLAPFKAKMLVAYFLSRFESEEIKHLEEIVKNRLLNALNGEQLFLELTKSTEIGGVGMTAPMAKKLMAVVDDVMDRSVMIKDQNESLKQGRNKPMEKLIDRLRHSLLEEFEGELTIAEVKALNKGIEYRLLSKINREEFMEYLDRSFSDGGVGLNRKTAKKLSRKMELIMLMEYGQ
ncbi:MAG: ABC transporter ATP-binding protein [Candidatus Moranbacteria bacterium]|nr:ABC transporter ATP-binding protein [Candidatus Moranbacteria bacterium]